MNRRGFMSALLVAGAAPSIVRAGSIMRINPRIVEPAWEIFRFYKAEVTIGPLIVVVLKSTTSYPCPWDLQQFGGSALEPKTVFVAPSAAGHCFPSGHSAGGFSFFAFYFAALSLRRRNLATAALLSALVVGIGFSAVRVVQGAHFLSHAFWAAGIDWVVAMLVFSVRDRLVGGGKADLIRRW